MARIERNAGDRTYLLTLRLIKVTDTFGALFGIDLVDQRTHGDRVVGALRFADVAVDAIVSDHQRHQQAASGLIGCNFFLQPFFNGRENEFRDIPAKDGNFAHDRARDELVLV